MSIFTYVYKPPPPEEIPMAGEPPIELEVMEEMIRTISESGRTCDHTSKQIKEFLQAKNLEVEPAFRWLYNSDIFCDCALLNGYQQKVLPQFSKKLDHGK